MSFLGLQQLGDLCFDEKSRGKILAIGRDIFKPDGKCPHCKDATLESMSILDAEGKGIVKIEHDVIRDMAKKNETQFVICSKCGWWGYPDKKKPTMKP